MNSSLRNSLAAALASGALALPAAAQVITVVDFGASASYVEANQVLNGYTATGREFSTTIPFNPATGYTVPEGLSGVFYGGASYVNNGAGTPQWGASGMRIFNNPTAPVLPGTPDVIRLFPTWGNTQGSGDGASKFYFSAVFLKNDFLNGAGGIESTASLASTSDTYSITHALGFGYQNGSNRIRLVVQNGSNWYVSNSIASPATTNTVVTTSGSFAERTWTDWNPASLNTIGVIPADPATFTNVLAVGFLTELSSLASVTNNTNGALTISEFTVNATVIGIPEPGTVALLGASGLLGLAFLRRRRG